MKKIVFGLLAATLLLFAGCESKENEPIVTNRYKITFVQGDKTVVKYADRGETLSDIPEITESKTGYTVKWSVADFSNISSDATVTLVFEPIKNVISYDLGECPNAIITSLTQEVSYDQAFSLYAPYYEDLDYEYVFVKWLNKATNEEFKSGVCDFTQNVELVAVWEKFTPSFPIN